MRYRFEAWELDLARGCLLHEGEVVPLRRKAFLVLSYLVRHHDRLVPRDELRAAAWPDVCISETTLATTIHEIRSVLHRRGCAGEPLRTTHGLGYRFVMKVEEVAEDGGPSSGLPTHPRDLFVGRLGLRTEAEEWLDDAIHGVGRAFLLSGCPGIGKSRTLLELGRLARARGFAVHRVRCLDEAGAPAYWPWAEVVRRLAACWPEAAVLARTGRFAAAFSLPAEGTPEPRDAGGPDAGDFLLFDSVSGLLREAACSQPQLLILDDLHHMGDASARLLLHVVRTLADVPLLVLGGLRERAVGAGHPVAALLAELHGAGALVSLPCLEPLETAELVASVAGHAPKIDVAAAIHARTGGHPLFVIELARALAAEHALDDADAVDRTLTPTIRRVIGAEIDLLGPDRRRILEAAACLGARFDASGLEHAYAGLSPELVREALQAAAQQGLVTACEFGQGTLRLAGPLLRDCLLESLSRTAPDVPGGR